MDRLGRLGCAVPAFANAMLGSTMFRNLLGRVVGFAAESQDLLQNAAVKLQSKNLDLIAANDISANDAGFAVETNRITLLFADGRRESLSLMSKTAAAETILSHIVALLE